MKHIQDINIKLKYEQYFSMTDQEWKNIDFYLSTLPIRSVIIYGLNNPIIQYEFLNLFKQKIDWTHLSQYIRIPANLLLSYKEFVDWDMITICQPLTITIISKLQNYINWSLLWLNRQFRLQEIYYLVENFPDKIEWKFLLQTQKVSKKFIIKYLDKIDIDVVLSTQTNLSKKFKIFLNNQRKYINESTDCSEGI